MNDNLQPLPDEHLEARITAYVLGESSPFESAEIEALIEKSPELQLFANRTRTLHTLLTEAETTANLPDENWKLSPKKRAKLDAILGSGNTIPLKKKSGIRRASIRAVIGIAAVVAITLFALSLVPAKYEAKASLSEEPQIVTYSSPAEPSKPASPTPSIPVPSESQSLAKNEVEFGNGADFGNGWGGSLPTLDSKTATPTIHIGGQVKEPGAVEFKEGTTLSEAIAFAGGATEFGSAKRVKLYRDGKTTTYDVTNARLAELKLQPGDTIEMPQKNWLGCGAGRDEVLLAEETSDQRKPSSSVHGRESDHATKGRGVEKLAESLGQQEIGRITPAKQRTAAEKEALSKTDALLMGGRESYAAGDFGNAVELYSEALKKLPETPANAERRQSYSQHLGDAAIAQAQRFGKVGKYDEARALLDEAASLNTEHQDLLKEELGLLENPIRINPALTYEHTKNVDTIRRNLYLAQGNFDLGKYDDAKKSYEETLRIDPYNKAARRGMERIAATKSDYYRAAYDQTRAELLMQVDDAWDLSVPAEADSFWGDNLSSSDALTFYKPQIDVTREFQYPTEYERPELPNSFSPQFPITPTIPETDDLNGALPILGDTPVLGKNSGTPAPTLTDLSKETSASQDPFSTFSLNVSDTSFQLARAAIEKGERPDPTSIKPEQFYNAIDYGDPTPSADEPVAAAIDQTAHPVIPGRNLVRIAVRTAATGRSEAQPLRLTLLVDQSGSMVREDRREAMENALAQLGTLLTGKDQVTVIGFSRTPRLLADSLPGTKAKQLPVLINQTASEGGTNLEQAITLASELALRHKLDGAQNRIVLFTDGAANLGNADPTRLSKKIETLRQQSIAFDIAGIGTTDVNDTLLSELARHGNGRYYLVGESTSTTFAKQLAGAFRPAAENVKVQVKLNPDRVGNFKLLGFEKDRLKTEDFRNDSVDAAELAAEEAGVAMYQIETLPEGSGEIGEVSVRFRQTSTGNMVERTWTIPYDPNAPAFDQADPKTQLATLALLVAQKLQGGPLADAINLNNYSKAVATLKRSHAKDQKTIDLLTLVESLR